jgi:hypothetical protein
MKNLVLAAVLAASLSVPAMAQTKPAMAQTNPAMAQTKEVPWTANGVKILSTTNNGLIANLNTEGTINYQDYEPLQMTKVSTRVLANPVFSKQITLNGIYINDVRLIAKLIGATCSMEGVGNSIGSFSQITPIINKATCTK